MPKWLILSSESLKKKDKFRHKPFMEKKKKKEEKNVTLDLPVVNAFCQNEEMLHELVKLLCL